MKQESVVSTVKKFKTMSIIYCFLCLVSVLSSTSGHPIDIDTFNLFRYDSILGPASMADMVLPFGYPLEQHEITTEDGYLLTMFRIPYGVNGTGDKKERPAVLIQHGILCSSAAWVLNEPQHGLAFIMADAGYDVWMGNNRGNTYSRKHKYLNPDVDKAKFWNFSFHEMGVYDLPAMIDFVIKETKQEQIYYVGHSQGTTEFFAMASLKPEYNKKIKMMSALAPIAYLQHTRGAVRVIKRLTRWMGLYEILSDSILLHFLDESICRKTAITRPICDNILFLLAGYDSQQLNISLVPIIADHTPAGASVKQLIHFGQLANNGDKFTMFDYGSGNMKQYGVRYPPEYDLSKITTPIVLHYALNDWLAGVKDVEKLSSHLNNSTKVEVPFHYFNHLDFMWAIDAKKLVYDDMIQIMKQHENGLNINK